MRRKWAELRWRSPLCRALVAALLVSFAGAQTIEFGVNAVAMSQPTGPTPPLWLRFNNVRSGAGTATLGVRLGTVTSVSLDLSANESFGPLGNVVFEVGGTLRTDALAEGAIGARGVLGPVALRVKLLAFGADVAEFRPAVLAGAERPRLAAPTVGLQLGVTARFNRNLILEAAPEVYWNRGGVALRSSATLRLLRTFGDNELQLKVRAYSPPGLGVWEGALGVGLLLPRGRAPDWSFAAYLGAGPGGWAPGAELDLAEQFGPTRVSLAASFEPYRLDVDPLRVSATVRTPLSAFLPNALQKSGSELELIGAFSADPFTDGGSRSYLGLGVRFPF